MVNSRLLHFMLSSTKKFKRVCLQKRLKGNACWCFYTMIEWISRILYWQEPKEIHSMKRSITIKDVASETSLAISTISKYMNGGNVREENRIIIEEAVKRLGYQPNKAARGLRNAKTYTVGLVINYAESEFFSKIAACIERALQEHGYSLILVGHKGDAEKLGEDLKFLIDEQVDGCIVAALEVKGDSLRPLDEAGIPVLLLDGMKYSKEAHYDSVMSNGAKGAYDAVEHLINNGHKEIAIIAGRDPENEDIIAGGDRMKGYERAFEDYGLEVNDKFVFGGDFRYQSGYEEMNKLWKQKDKPTAIFIINYNMALGAMTAIHELGINIPEDLSFVMFDDMEFSTLNKPRITAVRQPIEAIAEQATNFLIRRMNDDWAGYPQQVRMSTEFNERDSVKDLKRL